MGRTHGKNSNLSFNGTQIEGELSGITQNIEVPAAGITSFADVYENALAGKKNTTYELDGLLDMEAGVGESLILAQIGSGGVSTIFDPTGSGPAADAPLYKCTASGLTGALVKSISISLPVGDKAGWKASLQVSGQLTRATA